MASTMAYQFVLTHKGEAFLSKVSKWRTSSKRKKYTQLLSSIEDGDAYVIQGKDLELLSKLLGEGYVEIDTSTIEEMVEVLPPEYRKVLSLYTKVAKEKPVSDEEVSSVFNFLKRRSKDALYELEENYEDDPTPIRTVRSLIRNAKTRGEKVIAIDSVMSLVHDFGSGLVYFVREGDLEDQFKVNKILNRLAEE